MQATDAVVAKLEQRNEDLSVHLAQVRTTSRLKVDSPR